MWIHLGMVKKNQENKNVSVCNRPEVNWQNDINVLFLEHVTWTAFVIDGLDL